MRIIYLDQNKWIDLAKAIHSPAEHPIHHAVLRGLIEEIQAGRLAVPLSFANIYETHKINDFLRRHDLAFLQATLSRGFVFRGRRMRLNAELGDFVRQVHGWSSVPRAENWFLSSVFFESVAEWGDARLPPISETVLEHMRADPPRFLYDFLVHTPEAERIVAVKKFSGGSDQLRQRIEDRRTRHANESFAMRRRIYSALLMIDELDLILEIARGAGVPWHAVTDIGSANARKIMNEVPIYHIERELALRLETQNRPIDENDFRDLQSFCAVLPYADDVMSYRRILVTSEVRRQRFELAI